MKSISLRVATKGLDEPLFDGQPTASVTIVSGAAGYEVRPGRTRRAFKLSLEEIARYVIAAGSRD